MRVHAALLAIALCRLTTEGAGESQRDYERQPASLHLFEDHPTQNSCDPVRSEGKQTVAFLWSSGSEFALHRKDQLSLSRKEAPGLIIHPTLVSVSIIGEQRDSYAVELCASAGKIDGPDAKQTLDAIRLVHTGNTLRVAAPQYNMEKPARAELRIVAPLDLPLTVDGSYSYIEITRAAGPVKVKTSHARVTIRDTSGSVDADASDAGMIDFAGERGQVRLTSGSEINLKITAKNFEGSLQATAKRPLRVILPDGFSTPFEARVHKAGDFVCRAEFCKQIKGASSGSEKLFRFGATEPVLRFVSLEGPVVIDSLESLQAAEAKLRQEAAAEAAKHTQMAIHINELAGSIHSEADARRYVESLWQVFAGDAPKWIGSTIINRVAKAEYAAVAAGQFIPEERIADAFNAFVQQIGAPPWSHVTPEELHNLRDGKLAMAKLFWTRDQHNIWTMPNIYHVDSKGNVAPGCRGVETLAVLYDLHEMFENVYYARDRIREGTLASKLFEEDRRQPKPSEKRIAEARLTNARGDEYEQELRQAQMNYVRQHGATAYERLIREMFERVFP